jgi:hypothetical protein
MVDNYVANAGSGGNTFASDDASGVHYPYVKLVYGADNTQTLVSTSNPMPVDLRTDNLSGNLDVNIAASAATVTVGGTLTDITTSVTPGTGAANLGKAEDAAHSSGDTGVMGLAVRRDADTSLVGTDGDYAPFQVDANGYLKVEIFDGGDSHTIDGSLASITTSVVPGTGATNLGKAEDAAHTTGDTGVMALAVRRDADTTFVGADGDYAPLAVSADGYLKVEVFDGGDSHTIDGSVSVTGTVATQLPTAATLADNASTPTAPAVGAFGMWHDGSTWDMARGDATNGLLVNLGANNDVSVTGTVTVDLAANNDVIAAGDVAHDTADSGNPVKIGGVARTTNPTAVADADRVDIFADDLGRLVGYPVAPRDLWVQNNVTLTNTTETIIIAAGGAGVIHDLMMLVLSNESASEVRVDIRDDTAGTVRFSIDLAADGGGAVVKFPGPFKATAADDNWTAQLSASVSSVYIFAQAVVQN